MSLVNSHHSPCPCTQARTHTFTWASQFMTTETRENSRTSTASRTRPYQVKDWCDFLSPWKACEVNMILEFSEIQESEQFLSNMNTSWPFQVVILQWHQRSWLQIGFK